MRKIVASVLLALVVAGIGFYFGSKYKDYSKLKSSKEKLVLDLRFDKKKARDYSKNNECLTVGNVKWADDDFKGSSAEFNGDGYVDCGNSEILNLSDSFTIELWIKFSTITTNNADAIIVMKGPLIYGLSKDERHGSSSVNAYLNNEVSLRVSDIELGRWQHLIFTYDKKLPNQNMKIYANGVLKGFKDYNKPISFTSGNLFIGGNGSNFCGSISEVKIYKEALSYPKIVNSFSKKADGVITPRKVKLKFYIIGLLVLAGLYLILYKIPNLLNRDTTFVSLIIFYVILFTVQINLKPFERYPEWDHFWVDVRTAGKIYSLKHALSSFELPVISPYIHFGWNLAGDHSSFWSPINLFIVVFPPQVVIMLNQIFSQLLGALGAYFFLKIITNNRFISFLGGITYISIPYVIGLAYYLPTQWGLFTIPFFLVLIHKLLEQKSPKNLIIFAVYSAFSIGLSSIYFLFFFPMIVFIYTGLMSFKYYNLSFFQSLKKSSILLFLAILSGSFYIFPLYNNLKTNSINRQPIKSVVFSKNIK